VRHLIHRPLHLVKQFFFIYTSPVAGILSGSEFFRDTAAGCVIENMGLTIRDVAEAAGVSTATVSNVLNKTGKVGTANAPAGALDRQAPGLLPNVHARHLASRDSRTLGIIVSDNRKPFFPEVIKSFEIRARQLGYDAILSDTNYDPRRTREAAERMMEHNVREWR